MTTGNSTEQVKRYRRDFRAQHIGNSYRGWLHFLFTAGLSTLVVAAGLMQLDAVQPLEWLAIPIVFFYANLVEYFGHRFPMHRPIRGLGLIYRRHACQHHRFFTDLSMQFDSSRDFKAVLFPPVLIVFYLGAFMLPTGLLMYFVLSANVAWLVVATGTAYFLNYELFHFAYHCDPESRVGRLALVRRLRRLHLEHHNPASMTRYNFNITYPIGDWLFGTRKPSAAEEPAGHSTAY